MNDALRVGGRVRILTVSVEFFEKNTIDRVCIIAYSHPCSCCELCFVDHFCRRLCFDCVEAASNRDTGDSLLRVSAWRTCYILGNLQALRTVRK